MFKSIVNIRKAVFAYSLVLAVMLLQTPVYGLGTTCALVTMSLSLLCIIFARDGGLSLPRSANPLLVFTAYFFLQIVLSPYSSFNDSIKFIAQALLTCYLFKVCINEYEHRYLIYSFEFVISVWAVLIIKSCLDAGPARLIHASIELFGSEIDPNYIGIPLVTATILLMNDILSVSNKKILVFLILGYLLNTIAIVETSSRGNLLSFAVGNALVVVNFLRNTKKSFKKYLVFAVVAVGFVCSLKYLNTLFEDNFARMTEIDSESGGRLELWEYSIQLWTTDVFTIIFGNGFGAVANMGSASLCSHNTYLQLLSETGLVGFMLYAAFILPMLKRSYCYDKTMGICMAVMLFQIFFLNAIDNRCVWGFLGWVAMLHSNNIYKTNNM